MKKLIKILGIIVVAITILQTNVKAFTIDKETEIVVQKYGYLPFHYIGEEKEEYDILKYEEEPVYSSKRGTQENEISVDSSKKYNDEKLEKILLNGYPVKTYEEMGLNSEEEAYFATQEAIFAYKEDKDMSLYIAEDEQGERILKCIENILDSRTEVKEEANVVLVDSEWKEYEENTEYKYRTYQLVSDYDLKDISLYLYEGSVASLDNKYSFEVHVGDIVKLVIPKESNASYPLDIGFNYDTYRLYSIYNQQDTENSYLIMKNENLKKYVNVTIKVDDVTTVTIADYDSKTNKIITDSMFEILDKDGNVVDCQMMRDMEGRKTTVQLREGEYYLKQVMISNEYNIINGMIGFNVKTGKPVSLNIYNSPKETSKVVVNSTATQINVTDETQNIVENDIVDVTNIKTINTVKDVLKQTNITNLTNNNEITNTIYQKNINQVNKNNKYDNTIWKESLEYYTLEGSSETSNMSRDDFMTYIDLVKSSSVEAPNLPSAVKE